MKKIHKASIIFTLIIFISSFTNAIATCSIVRSNKLKFRSYDTLDNNDNTSQSRIVIRCTSKISFNVKLSSGNSGSFSQRILNSKSNNLNYNIYLDNAYTSIWGDGTNGSNFYSGIKKGRTRLNTFAKVPARQNIPAGSYSDSIIVTLEF